MHPDLRNLIELQRYDLEAKVMRDRMAALPRQIAALEAKLGAVEGQRSVVLDLLAKEEALRRRQESDIKDWQGKDCPCPQTDGPGDHGGAGDRV